MDAIVTFYYEQKINNYHRTNNEYIDRFRLWAEGNRNYMIVFVQKHNEELIKSIRQKYLDKTKIVIIDKNIDNYYSKYIHLIKRNILKSEFKRSIYKYSINNFEWQYCSIWMLKLHFINEASKLLSDDDNIIYIDFGLTELRNIKCKKEDFNKEISFKKFDNNRVNIFKYSNYNIDKTMFVMLENNIGYIYACIIALNNKLVKKFYEDYFDIMNICLRVGFNPVDQDILYMMQNETPSFFNVIELHEFTANIVKYVFGIDVKKPNVSFPHILMGYFRFVCNTVNFIFRKILLLCSIYKYIK